MSINYLAKVEDFMLLKNELFLVSRDQILAKTVSKMAHHSYIFLYNRKEDTITSVITPDLLAKHWGENKKQLYDIAEEPIFIPEQTSAFKALDTMVTENKPLAIVVDEYGCVNGVIFVSTILSFLFSSHTEPLPSRSPEHSEQLLAGSLLISQLPEKLKILLDANEDMTLSKFIYQKLQRFPQKNEIIKYSSGLRMHILEVSDKKIRKIAIILPK